MENEDSFLDNLPRFSKTNEKLKEDRMEVNKVSADVDNVIEGEFTNGNEISAPSLYSRVYFIVDEQNIAFGEQFLAHLTPAQVYNEYLIAKQNENSENSFKIYARNVEIAADRNEDDPVLVKFDEHVERVDITDWETDPDIDLNLTNEDAIFVASTEVEEEVVIELVDPVIPGDDILDENNDETAKVHSFEGEERIVTEGSVEFEESRPQPEPQEQPYVEQDKPDYGHSTQQDGVQNGYQQTYYHSGPAGVPVTESRSDLGQTGAHVVEGVGNFIVGGAVLAGSAAREAGNLMKALGAGISQFGQKRWTRTNDPEIKNERTEPDMTNQSQKHAADNSVDQAEVQRATGDNRHDADSPDTVSDHMLSVLSGYESSYRNDIGELWGLDKMSQIREKLKNVAHERGTDLTDVVQSLPHDPTLTSLFNEVKETIEKDPKAKLLAEKSDQSLNDWCDAYSALHERQQRSPDENERDELDTALNDAKSSMEGAVSESPVYDDESQSQLEKLKEMVQQIVEKMKEFLSSLTGKKEEQYTPSPSI